MPAETKTMDPAKALERAKSLLNLASGKGNANEKKAAALKLGQHLVKHPFLLEPAPTVPGMGVVETVARVREEVARVQTIAADPNVRETAASIANAATAVGDTLGKVANLFGKARGRR